MQPYHFVIAVHGAPYQHQGASSAWHFANAVLKKGHHIKQVFFMMNGVYHANKSYEVPNDETHWTREWYALSQQYHFALLICSTAAARRGITADLLAPGFQLAGLAQYFHALGTIDRNVVFGN